MEEGRVNGFGLDPRRGSSDWGPITLLDKTKEFFQTCDMEGNGFITRTDMRRLHRELPLSAEELEDVFDSLDAQHSGYLTLEAFSSGFSKFLQGRRLSEDYQGSSPAFRNKEALYQSQWEAKLSAVEDEEERHFCMLLESLGASNVFEDPEEVRSLWTQLRRDEPHLLSNFEEFLARVTHQIKEAHQEKKEMESALQRKAATHDSEIRHLYEEMEAQIRNEKERLLLKATLTWSTSSPPRRKSWKLELQCRELNSEKQESYVENVKLKVTNDELSRALESTSQELSLAQEQLAMLQEQAARLHQEKEMEMYRVTEGLQREKQSLMKQLDLLREMNKHLKDERDIYCGVPRASLRKKQKQRTGLSDIFDDANQPPKRTPLLVDGSYQSLEALPIEHLQIVFVASSSCSDEDAPPAGSSPTCQPRSATRKTLANGFTSPAPPKIQDVKAKSKKTPSKTVASKKVPGKDRGKVRRAGPERKLGEEEEVLDAPPDGFPLRRVISIEEDHLPHLLQGGPQPLLHQLSEEDDEVQDAQEAPIHLETSVALAAAAPPSGHPAVRASRGAPTVKKAHVSLSSRGRPVGKEAHQKATEGALFAPDRLFKVVLVGNSSVGKTSLLRSFCEGRFHPSTTATVGIDYSVKTLTLDNMQVAMQLWDTAGQERYCSITKQFFRKADGVVVMYDVTVEESFRAVKPWLANVQEAAGEGIPILLLGNKMDMDESRQVPVKEAEKLAQENRVMFSEVSAYTSRNVTESLTHLARVLMEQEDRVRDTTVVLSAQPIKKKPCCK
ncbi:EF-hand calcium-binding domain-containing protein 4B [Takifugu flavidus]|uniref:EF-hand calcium-binding domain-containing protein 4B n=1 Tax=Takifugu flavidus TaxID=433684 RepID=A0A5C6NFC4_9TELE|nr:EF-hand calcium-binding domain-containing protein 4B [Takifugu flavidus]